MEVCLARLTKDLQDVQRGVLIINGQPELCTLELPWRDNKKQISCIPAGDYLCHKAINRITGKGKTVPMTFEVNDVPNRSGILFHAGNTSKDTEGCILLGQKFGVIAQSLAVLESKQAFDRFLKLLFRMNDFKLRIYYGI